MGEIQLFINLILPKSNSSEAVAIRVAAGTHFIRKTSNGIYIDRAIDL